MMIGLVTISIFIGCSHNEVSVKEDKNLVYTPIKLPDVDKNIEKEDAVTTTSSDTMPKEELSDFQKHMLYKDYKIRTE